MQEKTEVKVNEVPQVTESPSPNGKQAWIEPDLGFIRQLNRSSGDLFQKCMQCGTCSATCNISPDENPFPRKEMAWANWGLRDLLLRDPDVWLCYHCSDCSTRCPRSARPGELLGAVRQATITHFSFPSFFARWVNEPQSAPIMLGIPILLLTLALFLKAPLEQMLGIVPESGDNIIFAYSAMFPHWLLISFFLIMFFLSGLVITVGALRYWNAIKPDFSSNEHPKPEKSMGASIWSALKSVMTHNRFAECDHVATRYWSHALVFFGFMGLTLVTLWIITARINPLAQSSFTYPFSFFSPWKILANVGGLAVLIGLCLMIHDRFKDNKRTGNGNYFDWAFISTILLVVLSGFATEVLHYVRLEPHRHLIYFGHLVFVSALFMYLPYSKFAHVVYRFVALVHAERTGRLATTSTQPVQTEDEKQPEPVVAEAAG